MYVYIYIYMYIYLKNAKLQRVMTKYIKNNNT